MTPLIRFQGVYDLFLSGVNIKLEALEKEIQKK